MDYQDRMNEVHEFDKSKIGVKGLVDSGITTIPRFFLHTKEDLVDQKTCSESIAIPIIDLAGIDSTQGRREIICGMSRAAREWGFFQVVNHGIPVSTLDATMSAIKAFHEQPQETKKAYYSRGGDQPVAYVANIDLLRSKAASWRDTLLVQPASSEQPEFDRIPEICREQVAEWSGHAMRLSETLLELLSEGLGLEGSGLKETKCSSKWIMVGQYYPHCPQPELTMGIPVHTDKGVLTVLIQDQMGGLQVNKGEEWVPVTPIHGALVINIGDFLQILSNGEYKSVKHRVLANPKREPRVSVAVFVSPSEEKKGAYGPVEELLSASNPPRYRNFTISERNHIFANKELGNISLPNEFRSEEDKE